MWVNGPHRLLGGDGGSSRSEKSEALGEHSGKTEANVRPTTSARVQRHPCTAVAIVSVALVVVRDARTLA